MQHLVNRKLIDNSTVFITFENITVDFRFINYIKILINKFFYLFMYDVYSTSYSHSIKVHLKVGDL